jgi:hypothetical protein
LGKRWHIVPDEDCKVLVVKEDLSNIKQYFEDPKEDYRSELHINYEKLSKDYDAIYISPRLVNRGCGDIKLKDSKGKEAYFDSFNWDVASCVFFKEKYSVMDEEEYCQYRKDRLLNEGKVSNKKVVEEKVEIEHKQKSGSITEPVEYDLVKVTSSGLSFEDNTVSNRDEVLSNEVETESQDNDSVKIEVLNKEVESENQANVTLEYEKELDFDFNNKETTSSRIFDISHKIEENDNKYWRQAAEVVVDRKDEEETILIDLTDENQETKRETFIDKFKKLSFVRKISDGIKKVKETIKNVYDSVKSRLSSFLGKKEVAEEVIILDEEEMNRTSNQSNLASKYDPQKYNELTGRGETQSKMKDDREFGPSNHNKTNSSVVSNKIYER